MQKHFVRLITPFAVTVSMACAAADAPAPPAPAAASDLAARVLHGDAPAREAQNDNAITARVARAIKADPGLAGSDISVNTDSGVVRLTGTVKSQEQAAIASAHAQRYDGVMRIDSHLATNVQ
jgi:hyperosmotically inducible protein